MGNFYINLLLWVVVGVLIGAGIYMLFFNGGTPINVAPGDRSVSSNTSALNTTSNASVDQLANPGPSTMDVAVLLSSECPDCNKGVQSYLEALNTTAIRYNVTRFNVAYVQSGSNEGKSLIAGYPINRLPVILVSSAGPAVYALKPAVEQGIARDVGNNITLFAELGLPYFDIISAKSFGVVKAITINASGCPYCIDASLYTSTLESDPAFVVFSSKAQLSEGSAEAQELIRRYNITRLPTLILSTDITTYGFFNESVSPFGTMEGDWFVLRNTSIPYVNLAKNHSVRGAISVRMIKNSSCTGCFNVSYLSDYLANSAGLFVANKTTYDVDSTDAKDLIHRYNLTMLPAMLYSPDTGDYPGFDAAWLRQNNTIESDGWYVFRQQDKLQVEYQNVTG